MEDRIPNINDASSKLAAPMVYGSILQIHEIFFVSSFITIKNQ